MDWRDAMREFYGRFEKDLVHAEENMTDINAWSSRPTSSAKNAGKPMVIMGPARKFIACTGYPGVHQYERATGGTVDPAGDGGAADLTEAG